MAALWIHSTHRCLLLILSLCTFGAVGMSVRPGDRKHVAMRFLQGARAVHSADTVKTGNASQQANATGSFTEDECQPPVNVTQAVKARGLSLLSSTSSHVIYGSDDDGPEMELFVYDCAQGKKLVFLHIPKNAGTTIENLGRADGKRWGRFHTPHAVRMPDGNSCMAWHVPPRLMTEPNPYADPSAEVFCVTRDPWDRMVSEYIYLLSVYYKWPMPHVMDGPKCTKLGFNAFVQNSIAEMERGHRYISDCHMLPQWDYIEDPMAPEHQWCQHVLDIGELTPQFNNLMSQHGLSLRMAPHNKDNSAASYCPAIKDAPMKDMYTEATATAMRSMYWKDFQHLGDSLASF
eukprot:TRINITY_DN20861_c0_g1_i1.p1 TRINITY_DN20861_c0_g1~~TRINITY_DN20861_c0_g1_i1.p1  ORF type:complete len:347 (+),score=36.57 TRINITY_DN20861_c0_g1_i1:113-1153(+)